MNKDKVAVTGVQRFTVRDGPGVRTTIFFKGCSLRCKWCHNPETMSPEMEICFHRKKCIGCGTCASVCPDGKFPQGCGAYVFESECVECGRCIDVCPVGAIEFAAKLMSVQEILDAALRDRIFYRNGGGVTFSGGEPLLQPCLPQVLKALNEEGVHTAVDTALNVPWENVEATLKWTDLYLADVKAMDRVRHRELTGVDNVRILDNLRRLSETGVHIWIRIPVVPGINDDQLQEIGDFIRSLKSGNIFVELIPYHDMASEKYRSLEKTMPLTGIEPPRVEQLEKYYDCMEELNRVKYT